VAPYKRRTHPTLLLENPDKRGTFIDISSAMVAPIALTFGEWKEPGPDQPPARVALLCPLCARSFGADVDPARRRILFSIIKHMDAGRFGEAWNHGTQTFRHPRCRAAPQVNAEGLRRLILGAYLDGTFEATLP
jgi:hypothetical protein